MVEQRGLDADLVVVGRGRIHHHRDAGLDHRVQVQRSRLIAVAVGGVDQGVGRDLVGKAGRARDVVAVHLGIQRVARGRAVHAIVGQRRGRPSGHRRALHRGRQIAEVHRARAVLAVMGEARAAGEAELVGEVEGPLAVDGPVLVLDVGVLDDLGARQLRDQRGGDGLAGDGPVRDQGIVQRDHIRAELVDDVVVVEVLVEQIGPRLPVEAASCIGREAKLLAPLLVLADRRVVIDVERALVAVLGREERPIAPGGDRGQGREGQLVVHSRREAGVGGVQSLP